MQEGFLEIAGIPTRVIAWGKWFEEPLDDVNEIVLCISGNPGLPGYYHKFLSALYQDLECSTPVWIIGHAGHHDPPPTSDKKVPPLAGNECLFNLEAQIKHKEDFIKRYIPPHVRIYFVGHSIGAFMILQMLKNEEIKKKVQKCYLLFPAIERLKETRNGWFYMRFCAPIIPILQFLLVILNKLPIIVKIFLTYIVFFFFSIPAHYMETTLNYLQNPVTERVAYLAVDKINKVGELDVDLVRDNKDLLKLFYAPTDGWAPVKYYREIKEKIPDLDAELADKHIVHGFVMRSSEEMALKVATWIRQHRVNSKQI